MARVGSCAALLVASALLWLAGPGAFVPGNRPLARRSLTVARGDRDPWAPSVLNILEPFESSEGADPYLVGAAWTRLAYYSSSIDQDSLSGTNVENLLSQTEQMLAAGTLGARQSVGVLWAICKLHEMWPESARLVAPITEAIEKTLGKMNLQQVTRTIIAAAELQMLDSGIARIMPTLVSKVAAQVDDLKASEVSGLLLAAAKLRAQAPSLLEIVDVLSEAARLHLTEMSPSEASNTMWAAGVLQEESSSSRELLVLLADHLPGTGAFAGMTGANLAKASQGLALSGTKHEVFLTAAADKAARLCEDGSSFWPQDLLQMFRSFIALDMAHEGLHFVSRVSQAKVQWELDNKNDRRAVAVA